MQTRECQRLKDQVVVVTGAAQGLGEALAIRLSEEGAKVVVGDMNLEGAQAIAHVLGKPAPALDHLARLRPKLMPPPPAAGPTRPTPPRPPPPDPTSRPAPAGTVHGTRSACCV